VSDRPHTGPTVRAVVLAAGAGRRFGGDKQLAELDGRPLLQHVLDVLGLAGVHDPIVVLGANAEVIRRRIDWGSATVVVNPRPGDGLSSSIRIGWEAAFDVGPQVRAAGLASGHAPEAVLLVLGDQPRLRPDVVAVLVAAPLDPARPIVAPAYAAGGGRNPARIERSAERLLGELSGDRGFGPLIDAHPGLVRTIEVRGDNPDVDRPADLDALRGA
jgi:molybdenum cofactor cytidylyltransferase